MKMKLSSLSAAAGSLIIFFACQAPVQQAEENAGLLKARADSIIMRTFDTLRGTLTAAIQSKGFEGAVEYCHLSATGITNIYSSENIQVKRTSHRLRNPANAPDSMEKRILDRYAALKNNQQTPAPVFEQDQQGNHHYFKPINIQAMCLNCHGSKDVQIQPATWQAIQTRYPADSAFNYKEGDLRGLWHLTMYKSKKADE